MSRTVGVLLMSFGTAAAAEDIPGYLARIRGGVAPPDDLVAEFQRRYRVVGGSPLTRITLQQAGALQQMLNATDHGARYHVAVGMRHAPPFIADGLVSLTSVGAERVVAIIMAPQHSPMIMAGYHKALADAQRDGSLVEVIVPGPWHTERKFLAALAQRVSEAIDRLKPEERTRVPVLFTAHSLPKAIVEQEPQYIDMLRVTARAVAERVWLPDAQWHFAYQSAGHTPQEWLKPDIKDLFPALANAGHKKVLIAPVQFLADHMEVLYDIDVEARQQASKAGIELIRTDMLNTMPIFIEAMTDVVLRHSKDSRTGKD